MDNNLIALYEPTAIELITAEKAKLQILADEAKEVLKIEITDTKTYDLVSAKQTELQKRRKSIEDSRLDFTRVQDEKKKAAIAVERDLTAIISEVEDKLKEKKRLYNEAQEAIKAEKERQEQARVQIRVDELAKYWYNHDLFDLRHMEDEAYQELKAKKQSEWEASEKIRLDKEEADRKEREEFERKKAEQEAKEKEIADREAAIKAAEDKIKSEENAKARAAELEQAQKDAAEKSRIDTEARIKRETEDNARQEREKKESDERQAQADKATLEKKKRYIEFLKSHGYTTENKHEFEAPIVNGVVTLKRILGTFKI